MWKLPNWKIRFLVTNAVLAVLLFTDSSAQADTTELISVDSSEIQGNHISHYPSVSADGRFIAFASIASNLHVDDVGRSEDIFVRHLETGITEIISVKQKSSGSYAFGGSRPSISGDGRFVSFQTSGSFVDTDTNWVFDIYVYDRMTQTFELASENSSNVGNSGNGWSLDSTISPNGRFVVFSSRATNLVDGVDPAPGASSGIYNLYVRDLTEKKTTLLSVSSDGFYLGNGNSIGLHADVNDNGDVAFTTSANNLIVTDTDFSPDILVRDQIADLSLGELSDWGPAELASVNSDGIQGNRQASQLWMGAVSAGISADGNLISFNSLSTNLIGDGNILNDLSGHNPDVFIRDRSAGTTEVVTVDNLGVQGNNSAAWDNAMSADGRYVVFQYSGASLLEGISTYGWEILVRDRVAETTELVSVRSDGTVRIMKASGSNFVPPANRPSLSTIGNVIAFDTEAADLILDEDGFIVPDGNPWRDVFARVRSPLDATLELIADVEALIDSGTTDLNRGGGNSLLNLLEDAAALIERGNNTAALDKLETFVGKVEKFVLRGDLTVEHGDLLLDAANDIIAMLSA